MKFNLPLILDSLIKDYGEHGEINQIGEANLPVREEVIQITRSVAPQTTIVIEPPKMRVHEKK